MTTHSKIVLFIGPLPPPSHGFAEINACMLALLEGHGPTRRIDLAPKGATFLHRLASALAKVGAGIFELLRLSTTFENKTLYLPLSGGIRQIFDTCFAVLARLLSWKVFIHHHSFAYINYKPWYSRFFFAVSKNATHIALCECMGLSLEKLYEISSGKITVLSNHAFLSPADVPGARDNHELVLTLGYFSQVSTEKGCFTFIETIEAALKLNLKVRGLIAGPIQGHLVSDFNAALKRCPQITYVGPVYGQDKWDYLKRLDVLLFPSTYINEAEPVAILEASKCGVPTIAIERGCISEIIPANTGFLIAKQENFVNACLNIVVDLSTHPEKVKLNRETTLLNFRKRQASSAKSLEKLINEITAH